MAARPFCSIGWRTVVSPPPPAAGTSSKPVTVNPQPAARPARPAPRAPGCRTCTGSRSVPARRRAARPAPTAPSSREFGARSVTSTEPARPRPPRPPRAGRATAAGAPDAATARWPAAAAAGRLRFGRYVLAPPDGDHAHPAMAQAEHVPGDRRERRPVVDADEVHPGHPVRGESTITAGCERDSTAASWRSSWQTEDHETVHRGPQTVSACPAPGRPAPSAATGRARCRPRRAPCRNSTAPGSGRRSPAARRRSARPRRPAGSAASGPPGPGPG